MLPTPYTLHQQVLGNLLVAIANHLSKKRPEVFMAPFDVRLSKNLSRDENIQTVIQPDICVICDRSKIDERGFVSVPNIMVEILSPGNNRKGYKTSLIFMRRNGVQEYWIVSPQDKTFMKYTLNQEGVYIASKLLPSDAEVTTPILSGFVLNFEDVFADD